MLHIDALNLHLSNERMRLANAKTDAERELRRVWVAQLEKEIAGEQKFSNQQCDNLSDDELLNSLGITAEGADE